jgi:hypothetical protein
VAGAAPGRTKNFCKCAQSGVHYLDIAQHCRLWRAPSLLQALIFSNCVRVRRKAVQNEEFMAELNRIAKLLQLRPVGAQAPTTGPA